jgi:hypothetical protein
MDEMGPVRTIFDHPPPNPDEAAGVIATIAFQGHCSRFVDMATS